MTRRSRWFATVSLCCTALMAGACGSDDDDAKDSGKANSQMGSSGSSGSGGNGGRKAQGGSGGGSAGESSHASTACDEDSDCAEPSVCKEQDGEKHCACPDGYDDVKGDGSECVDKDECKGDNDCDGNAECKNEPGSYKCTCRTPAYQGDGKSCECADGFAKSGKFCLAPEGGNCSDNLDCSSDHCVSGICCKQACTSPDGECRNVDAATCSDGTTCKYPVADNGTACDDGNPCTLDGMCQAGTCEAGTVPRSCDDANPCTDDSCDSSSGCKNVNNTAACDDNDACTEGDQCKTGRCQSTRRDCSAAAAGDACNEGVCDPASGECKKQPADGKACNDADSCTTGDKCVAGACVGGSACGPTATGCALAAAADGSMQCACTNATSGEALTCAPDIDPCLGNPCGEGRGTCSPMSGVEERYSCTCSAGLTVVGGTCGCNLAGTFAKRTEIQLQWDAADPIEAGTGSTYVWSIERHTYNAAGGLDVTLTSCGETNLDLCGNGVALVRVPAEAYAQYVPINVWQADGPSTALTTSVSTPWPTGKFTLPEHAVLQGISLTDPLGAWPASNKEVRGYDNFTGTATNGAQWINSDNDDFLGLTTYVVGPAGVAADNSLTAPISAYGATSPTCPRGDASAARSPYNYVPAADGLTLRRVTRFSSANRVTSAIDGAIDACDPATGDATTISGSVVGTRFDTRIGDCMRTNGSAADVRCSQNVVDFADETSAPNRVTASTFVMKRIAATASCADVRALLTY